MHKKKQLKSATNLIKQQQQTHTDWSRVYEKACELIITGNWICTAVYAQTLRGDIAWLQGCSIIPQHNECMYCSTVINLFAISLLGNAKS